MGSVTAGMAIYDTMQFVGPDVGTICMGLGASMGQFLLCAGAPGKRFALPHARILMHQPSGGVQGQASDIAIQAEQMAYTKRLMAERIAEHTGQTVEQIQEDSERDRWFTAERGQGLRHHRQRGRQPARAGLSRAATRWPAASSSSPRWSGGSVGGGTVAVARGRGVNEVVTEAALIAARSMRHSASE